MILVTLALLLCVFPPQEAVVSRTARCSASLCCFWSSLNFSAAAAECGGTGGRMVRSGSVEQMEAVELLLLGLSGSFWLDGGANCSSVSMGTAATKVRPQPCRNLLDGFLCIYESSACGPVRTRVDVMVTYMTATEYQVLDSDSFPPGTRASLGRPGASFPESRHLCTSTWIPAPWNCEVLRGGCDHGCADRACTCPAASSRHRNNVSCVEPEEDELYELDDCTCEDAECVNLRPGYRCECAAGFVEEDGECVNNSICSLCEHMECDKVGGAYRCMCMDGFRVSTGDPTRCEQVCDGRECPAICHRSPELELRQQQQCLCPPGYILDFPDGTPVCHDIDECDAQQMCEHECQNLFGGFRCSCRDGYRLEEDGERCVRLQGEEEEDVGSGLPPALLPPGGTSVGPQPAALPSYIRTGSALGIALFLLLCAALLACVIRAATSRCRRFDVSSLKHPDIDIFYLQQVSTETYKRLSFDRPFKSDQQPV